MVRLIKLRPRLVGCPRSKAGIQVTETYGSLSVSERLLQSAPNISLSSDALRQIVSWSTADDRTVSLGEFIAARNPQAVRALHLGQERAGGVKDIRDLSD